jgi:hypothetical protein
MKKIYVACPAFLATGGTELLHQLVHSLSQFKNFKPFLFYSNYDVENETPEIPAKFLKYVTPERVTDQIEDAEDNLLIVPEVLTPLIPRYPSMKKAIWWLSVDNFFEANQYPPLTKKIERRYLFRKFFGMKLSEYEKLMFNRTDVSYHLYQSEYARLFLLKRGMSNLYPLSDYLNDDFFKDEPSPEGRRNIIVYNPVKGFDFTKQLIAQGEDLEWVPIKNMLPSEVAALLSSAKLYIDFGAHPGKDRIPREAVIKGCCIITGKNGAGNNSIDIPIPETYKFENDVFNIPAIIAQVKDIFKNFESHYTSFDNYRSIIRSEKARFEQDLIYFLKSSNYLDESN